jgi:hypothetical protein
LETDTHKLLDIIAPVNSGADGYRTPNTPKKEAADGHLRNLGFKR